MNGLDVKAIGEALRKDVGEPLLDQVLLARSGLPNGLSVMLTTDTGEAMVTIIARVGLRALAVRMTFTDAAAFAKNLEALSSAFLIAGGR